MTLLSARAPSLAAWILTLLVPIAGLGCDDSTSHLLSIQDEVELPPGTVAQRAVEVRVARDYFDSLLEFLPEQLESALTENDILRSWRH